ncbi:MAG: protein arginine kinase [Gemmatimonadota bacterium]
MSLHRADSVGEQGVGWLAEAGPEAEVVLSTRVRLARNLQGFPFTVRADGEERARIFERVQEALDASEVLHSPTLWEMPALHAEERSLLIERHVVSRELVGPPDGEPPPGAALALAESEVLGLMINEEDHVRLQALLSGLQLERAWREVEQLDEELGHRLPFAFHHEFGYLTSCPTNVGTGLRASVLIHLPGLVLTKQIGKVLQGIGQIGLTFRGLYGEGSEVVGNFFQVSNQTTLGKTEEDLIDHLGRIVTQVIEYEKQARAVLLREAPAVLEDKVWRAYGILRHARSVAFDELMNLLSGVRLGITLKLLPTPRVETLNRIMIYGQTAHLERSARRRLDETDADIFRASFVRESLAADERPGRAEPGGRAGDAPRGGASPGPPRSA